MEQQKLISRTVVIFELPLGISLPDGIYDVLLKEGLIQVTLKKIEKEKVTGLPENVKIASGAVIQADRWGRLYTTHVNIILNHSVPISNEESFKLDLKEIPQISVRAINRIMNTCRQTTHEFYVDITWGDIFSHSIKHYDSKGNELPGSSFSLAGGGAIMKMGGSGQISDEQLKEIKNILKNYVDLPLENNLILNANTNLFYENFRIAIIEAETAFEDFINNYILQNYQKLGKSVDKIHNILNAPFQNLLKDHIKKITNFDFGESPEYEKWNNCVYEKRNAIVHEGISVSREETNIAIRTVVETIDFITKIKINDK